FGALLSATKNACKHANIFVDDGGDKFVHLFTARLFSKASPLISRDEQRTDTVPARRTLISLTKSAVRMKSRPGDREYPLGRYRCPRGRGACHVSSYNSRTVPASCDASLFPKTCPPRPGGVALVPRRDRHTAPCRGITCGAGAMSADVWRRGTAISVKTRARLAGCARLVRARLSM